MLSIHRYNGPLILYLYIQLFIKVLGIPKLGLDTSIELGEYRRAFFSILLDAGLDPHVAADRTAAKC